MAYNWQERVSKLRGDNQRINFLEQVYSTLLRELDKTNADLFPYNGIVALEQIVGRLANDEFDVKKRLGIVKAEYTYNLAPYFNKSEQSYSYDINLHGEKRNLLWVCAKDNSPERKEIKVQFDGEDYRASFEHRSRPIEKQFRNGGIVYCEDIPCSGRRSVRWTNAIKVSGVKKTSHKGVLSINGWLYNLSTDYSSQPVMVFLDGNQLHAYDFAKKPIKAISSKRASN